MTPWTLSWAISAAVATTALVAARRSGLPWRGAVAFAAACFATPLGVALGSRNSFVYAIDLLAPALLVFTAQRWSLVPRPVRWVAVALALGGGVLPFAGVLFTWGDRGTVLANGINAVRTVTVAALLALFASWPLAGARRERRLLHPLALLALAIAVTVALQATGHVDVNVFHQDLRLAEGGDAVEARLDQRLAVLGLFRGSMGIACMLAVCAWLVVPPEGRAERWLLRAGALGGVLAVVAMASKTTLVSIVALVALRVLLFGARPHRAAVAPAAAVAALVAAPWIAGRLARNGALLLAALGTSTSGLTTLTGRSSIWQKALADLAEDPARWFGVATSGALQPAVGVYHNEWLAVLMTGGVAGLLLYAGAVVGLAQLLWVAARDGSPLARFALLAFLGMGIQALSVAHLQPNLFFLPVVAPLLALYGLSARQASATGTVPAPSRAGALAPPVLAAGPPFTPTGAVP